MANRQNNKINRNKKQNIAWKIMYSMDAITNYMLETDDELSELDDSKADEYI